MNKLTTEQWVQKAKSIHGDKYDYDKVHYINHCTPVTITCPQHGDFQQRPSDHTHGRGCSECSGVKRWSTSEFIKRARRIHGDRYDYAHAEYKGVYVKTTIVCPTHGPFQQSPGDHVNKKAGCRECAREYANKQQTKTTDQFILDAERVHGNKYDYSKSKYEHSHSKLTIICPEHGTFKQAPNDHVNNQTQCPQCSATTYTSKGQQQLTDWLTSDVGVNVVQNDRKQIHPYELDIYIPTHKLAVEYCGLYWHNEANGKHKQYHSNKHKLCKQNNIRLITLFEDEWLYRQSSVKNKIIDLLHKNTQQTIYARKCSIQTVSAKQKRDFFNKHHIQGNGPGSITYALTFQTQIVAMVTLIQHDNVYYLNRYATKYKVVGGFTKLVEHFKQHHNWKQIISFADQRWSDGHLYHSNEWILDKTLPPDYYYIQGNKRIHKFNFRRKILQHKLEHFDPYLSETQNCANHGINRIWDCGKLRYIITNTGT